ncbi:hypothetical protein GGI12_000482 [Dipsacomyces acuminosporus]|nr:hypothetical protein GGI12_000482 [Dipsacomyces acuminosporus]
MNITCAGFDVLPKVTYDNVAPQALERIIIVFKQGTSPQILDSFRDALSCRGGKVDAPSYNIGMLTALTPAQYAKDLEKSSYVASVEDDDVVTALTTPTINPTGPTVAHSSEHRASPTAAASSSFTRNLESFGLDGISESSSGNQASATKPSSGNSISFSCGMALAAIVAARLL